MTSYKWRTLDQLFKHASQFWKQNTEGADITAESVLASLENLIGQEEDVFAEIMNTYGAKLDSEECRREHEATLNSYKTKRDEFLKICYIALRREMTEGLYIGFGYPTPQAKKLIPIPARHWGFLEPDFDRDTAFGEGMFWYGLKFLDMQELDDNQRSKIEEMLRNSPANSLPEKDIKSVNLSGVVDIRNRGASDKATQNKPEKESPQERRNRLTSWLEEEISSYGVKGAVERVAGREGVSRQRMSSILNESPKASELLIKID
ncbi:MAG: hypothetical protein HQL69_21915 [Magnetococcales bacterium]|nr:hypothetical protein [Magnetococcales bacterium]